MGAASIDGMPGYGVHLSLPLRAEGARGPALHQSQRRSIFALSRGDVWVADIDEAEVTAQLAVDLVEFEGVAAHARDRHTARAT